MAQSVTSPVQAIDKIFLLRVLGESGNAWKIAFQTESETEEERDYDSEPTKDGAVKAAGAYEATHSLTSFMAKGDTYIGKIKDLIRSNNPGRLEVWEIDRTDIDTEDTLPGDYSVDVVTSVATSADSEGSVEIEIETEVEGTIVSGDVDVTSELRQLLRQITSEREFVQPMESGNSGGGESDGD